MNKTFRSVWNERKQAYVAAAETVSAGGRRSSSAAVLLAPAACALGLLAGAASAADLPTGGQVVAGTASISTTGSTMNVLQSTQRAAINWQSFSIGSHATVNFQQPSASAVVLNRVVGNEASVINGALNANGQVFLLNSSGVLFGQGAQVNVGGLVASTLSLSDADFMAGKTSFSAGASQGRVVNLGTLTAADGGYIALLGQQVANEGVITARLGTAALAAGDKISLNFNGNSLLGVTIDQGTLGALVENRNAIVADGGLVVLTAQGLDAVMATVVNNSGEVRARTVGEREGRIYLLGGMDNDRIEVGGTLDASAPGGGKGGFIETSAANVKVQAGAQVRAGHWLIDPVDITIDQTLADTIQTALGAGDVTISTAGGNTPDTSAGEQSTGSPLGDIHFNGNLAWSANTLVLRADNDIWIRGNLTGTGTAKLGLEYGQARAASAWNNLTAYTVLGSISLPADSFYAKYGTNGSTTFGNMPVFLNNGYLRFGNGSEDSVDQYGSLRQPFYYNTADKRWYKLTYSDSPMFLNIGFGGTGYADGTIISNQYGKDTDGQGNFDYQPANYIGATTFDVSGYANGRGTVVASNVITDGSVQLTMRNTYTLATGNSYLEATTRVSNNGGTAVDNVRLWSGTRDDWIGTTDGPRKEKGNFVNGVFVPNTAVGQAAKVVRVTSDTEGILFYSTSSGAETTIGSCCSPDFHLNSAGDGSPLASPRDTPFNSIPLSGNYSEDGNYSVYSSFANLGAGSNRSIVWYYAGGEIANLATIVTAVSQAAEAATGGQPAPVPAPVAAPNVNDGVVTAARAAVAPPTFTLPASMAATGGVTAAAPVANVVSVPPSVSSAFGAGTRLSLISSPRGDEPTQAVSLSEARAMLGNNSSSTGGNNAEGGGDVRVPTSRNSLADIVNGGVKLPDGVEQELFVVQQ